LSTCSHRVSTQLPTYNTIHLFPIANTALTEYFVDVEDVGILHLIALTNSDVQNERVFAYGETFDWNQMLSIFRKNFPNRTFHDDFPGIGKDISTIVPRERAAGLLKDFGREGFKGLEGSLLENLAAVTA
jgi:hypothetical protein